MENCELEEKLFAPKKTRQVLHIVPSGEIATELGADGLWLRFDCDCADALPYCQAQCCALLGTIVFPEEIESGQINEFEVDLDGYSGMATMKRGSDGFCNCLDRSTRTCNIYDRRPQTCQNFHCSKGSSVRGWPQTNHVSRQAV